MKVADLPELKGEVKFQFAFIDVHALIIPCPGTVETCSKEALIWEGAISNDEGSVPCGDLGIFSPYNKTDGLTVLSRLRHDPGNPKPS